MMPTLDIAIQSLRILKKDKTAIIWMLLIPVFYILFFGSAFKSQYDPSKARAYIGLLNFDTGYLSQEFINGIKSEQIEIDTLKTKPENPPTRLLIIPENFTNNLLNTSPVTLIFEKKNDSNVEAGMAAEMAIRKSYLRILANLAQIKIENKEINIENLNLISLQKSLIKINAYYAGSNKIIPSGFNHQVPANIVFFTLLIVFIYAGGPVIEEKNSGILRRIQVAPISFQQLFIGKLTGVTLIGVVQFIILVFFGRFVFGVYFGPSILALVLLGLLFSSCCAAMGLCLGLTIKNEEKMTGIAIIISLVMAAMSGCWWPLEVVPRWMAKIGSLLPAGIALSAYHQLISYGRGIEAIWQNLLALLIITTVFTIIFVRVLAKRGLTT